MNPIFETSAIESGFSGYYLVVLFVVGLTILTAVAFFIMTLVKRLKHISEDKQRQIYQEKVEVLLFQYLFNDVGIEEVKQDKEFQKDLVFPFFQQVCIKALISLHHNYSGAYSKKLEQFYVETGLVNYSLKKLNSPHWTHIVEGLRDLSTFNYEPAYSKIAYHITNPDPLVKLEVIVGIIKIKGITEILKFQNSGLYFNDWVQSNILFTVKKFRISAPKDLGRLLKSQNRSLVLLAVRLIYYYESSEFFTELSEFYHKTEDKKLKYEISLVMKETQITG